MVKITVFLCLFTSYVLYSFLVYSKGTERNISFDSAEVRKAAKGKQLFQEYNCIACHQVYGLGGYLGPDLTNAWSDKTRGEAYIRAMLKSGGKRMPQYRFSDDEVDALAGYLKYIDNSTKP